MASSAVGASSPVAAAFYGKGPVTAALRWGLAVSQQLAPGLAVRAAHRLFGTPLPRARPPAAWDGHWTYAAWPFEQGSLGLYQQLPAPRSAPLALLVHGWGGHAGQMRPLASALAAGGHAVMVLEMPAHGRSAGRTSNLPQFARALDYVAARLHQQGHAPVDTLVAHSLGANAAAYAASRGLPARRLVLLAPPASPHHYTRLFAQVFGLNEATRAAMQRRIEAREAVVMQQFEPEAVGPRIRAATLVAHDRDDHVNRFDDGARYHLAIVGATLLATEGLGHRKILADPAVLAAVTRFAAA